MFADWTQMDPAIMSTSVNFAGGSKPATMSAGSLSAQQQELFAHFNKLSVQQPCNGLKPLQQWGAPGGAPPKLGWGSGAFAGIPLPPGFTPPKATAHPAECIDAK